MSKSPRKIIVGLSGSSGAIYGRRLVDVLDRCGCEVHLIVTEPARGIVAAELGVETLSVASLLGRQSQRVKLHDNDDLYTSIASGSCLADGMAICPCSSHSVAALAAGSADTLLLRSAYVTLKQRRPLVIVHREMPLTAIDIENMARLTRAGAIICPASPPFYMQPKTIDDLVDTVVARVLDLLGVEHDLKMRWQP